MTQTELNRAVARATGESIRRIARRGFSLLTPLPAEREPRVVDWDRLDAKRRRSFVQQLGADRVA